VQGINSKVSFEFKRLGDDYVGEERCQRPGCNGLIVDGVCEDCGRPPVGKSLISEIDQTNRTGNTGTASKYTGTVGSSRTGSRRATSRSSTKGTSSRRRALGGGLVSLPELPKIDPSNLIMEKPEVPERKRYCPNCEAKVNRTRGFCPNCGNEYNFEPTLKAGDMVNGKYEIKGPMAFGGLGWIYLAYDTVLSRWVILKGLLNARDEASAAAAVAERQFLAAVKHPKIVGIYDFIQYNNTGYIVMEFVGGKTISSIRKEKGPLPVEEAVSYILGILPAFSYLHQQGIVYCDFKPDNFMVEGDDVKLIDMGGVRKIGDPNGDIFGTRGYMAPEASDDPVEVSDLYTIGRSLAALIMDFKFQTDYEYSLPTPSDQKVLAENEALYKFLLRACNQDPDARFQTADEMYEQLYGVLREIVALKTTPKPMESNIFTSDNLLNADDTQAAEKVKIEFLPTLKIDVKDICANEILRLSSIVEPVKRIDALKMLADKYKEKSEEARYRLADVYITVGKFEEAEALLKTLETEDEFDWRVHWYRGKLLLTQHDCKAAKNEFEKVYFEMPGEVAPKLAIGYCAELGGVLIEAENYYTRVSKVDPNNTTACFGLARCLRRKGDIVGASNALNAVPANHSMYSQSRIMLAEILMMDQKSMNEQALDQLSQVVGSISIEGGIVHQLMAKVLTCAVNMIEGKVVTENSANKVLGCDMRINSLRKAAEAEYRKAAHFAETKKDKIFWVDLANSVRPVTLF
jgi:Serine/threonine protein kinase